MIQSSPVEIIETLLFQLLLKSPHVEGKTTHTKQERQLFQR